MLGSISAVSSSVRVFNRSRDGVTNPRACLIGSPE
jgi:hypothetical protein